MKRVSKLLCLFVLLLGSLMPVWSQSARFVLEAAGLKQAEPPAVIGDHVLLSYQFAGEHQEGQIHTVAAAFEHESFSNLHAYSRNEHGVYVLAVPRAPEIRTFRYRLVVDGVWTIDPNAPAKTTDRWGVSLSQFDSGMADESITEYPSVGDSGRVEFRLVAPAGRHVAVVGSFNGWDPFMTPLAEVEPGRYSRIIRLPAGEHLYYFMMDGMRFPDPGNGERRTGASGRVVSVVVLPPETR